MPRRTAGVTPLYSASTPSFLTTDTPVENKFLPSGPATCCLILITSTQLVMKTALDTLMELAAKPAANGKDGDALVGGVMEVPASLLGASTSRSMFK